MKKSVCWVSVLLLSALMLSGCSASDQQPRKTGGGEGTNTGNGSCTSPICFYPRVASTDDGKAYAGVLNIYDLSEPVFGFIGHVEDYCDPITGPDLHMDLPLRLVSVESNGTMRFRSSAGTKGDADLTLTSELDLSGTLIADLAPDPNGIPVLVESTRSNAAARTTTFTVQGKASVYCAPDESSISLPLDGNVATLRQLECREQPTPPALVNWCNDNGQTD